MVPLLANRLWALLAVREVPGSNPVTKILFLLSSTPGFVGHGLVGLLCPKPPSQFVVEIWKSSMPEWSLWGRVIPMMDASLREGVRDIRQFQHPQLWFHFWLTEVHHLLLCSPPWQENRCDWGYINSSLWFGSCSQIERNASGPCLTTHHCTCLSSTYPWTQRHCC